MRPAELEHQVRICNFLESTRSEWAGPLGSDDRVLVTGCGSECHQISKILVVDG